MAENRQIPIRDLKLLWGRAAGLCSKCRRRLLVDATTQDRDAVLGEMAHVIAHGDEGPRADPALSASQRREYGNLVLLCPTCHTLIDKQEATYSCDVLRRMKSEHEAWVDERLADQMPEVGFAELEVVCKAIAAPASISTSDLDLTPPREKLAKNGLSSRIAMLVQMGMIKSGEVASYLANFSTFDDEFPERLKAGFIGQYQSAREGGLTGDALFVELHGFASGGGDPVRAAAGLAVVVYLFETCEIFER